MFRHPSGPWGRQLRQSRYGNIIVQKSERGKTIRMLSKFSLFTLLVSLLVQPAPAQNGSGYPKAKRVEQVDDYHGVKVSDPYRWMEETTSADTQSWIEQQNKITSAYFATIPQREKIKTRLT